ncbi:MAG: YfhO family protein [bacterium]
MSWLQSIKSTIGEEILELSGAALFLVLALLIFFWPAVFGGRVLLPADLIFDLDPLWRPLAPEGYTGPSNSLLADQVYQFHPWEVFARRSIAQGQLPLWNPYTEGGLPFVGNAQSAVFCPFSLVGYLFPLYASYVVRAILRFLVAGIFTYVFARDIGIGVLGALLAMVTFTFSGPMVMWLGHPHSSVIVWLPAILFTTERTLTKRSGSYVVACGVVIGAQFLGGHPETSFHVMLAWAVFTLYRIVSLEGWHPAKWFLQLARTCGAALLGVMVAAIQLLPFSDALLRSATLPARTAKALVGTPWSIARLLFDWHEWPTAITTLLPQYFGTSLDDSYWFPHSNYMEQNAYVGILPLVLAIVTVLHNLRPPYSKKRDQVLLFGSIAVISLGVALRLPGLNMIDALPLLRLTANGRLRLIYAFAMAILSGFGMDEFSTETSRSRLSVQRILTILALGAIVLIGATYAGFVFFRGDIIQSGRDFMETNWSTTPYLSRSLEYYYDLVEERYHKKLALFRPDNVTMYMPVLVTLGWIGIHKWERTTIVCRKVRRRAILGLVVFDLFVIGMPFNSTAAPDEIFPAPKPIRFLDADEAIYRVSGTDLTLYPNSGMLFNLHDIRGYDTVVPQRYVDLVDHLDGHYRFHFHSLFREASSPLWDLLNVKYAITDQGLEGKWELAYQGDGGINVYRNTEVVPRAFIVHRVTIAEGPGQSLERVLSSSFDFREEVVLEESPVQWTEPSTEAFQAASARVVDYQPNHVTVDVKTATDGLLVLTDTYAPGWKALLEDNPVPVYVADHTFRAVLVPAGAHRVTFVYRPQSFYVGATLSLLGLVVGSIMFLRRQLRHSDRLP